MIWATVSWPVTSRVWSSWARTNSCMSATEGSEDGERPRAPGGAGCVWRGGGGGGAGVSRGEARPSGGTGCGPRGRPASSAPLALYGVATGRLPSPPDPPGTQDSPGARTRLPLTRRRSPERGKSDGAHVLTASCVLRHLCATVTASAFIPPTHPVRPRPLETNFRFRARSRKGRGQAVARAEKRAEGVVQDGGHSVPGCGGQLERRCPAELRATEAGEREH